MNGRKRSVLIAVSPLVALLLTPLLACDQPRRHSHSSHYYTNDNTDYQRQLAADQRRRHEQDEQRHLDEPRRQDREQSYGRRY